jgi:hypothetical protein
MFQTSGHWILFGLGISIKVILLALFAGIALKLVRVRDPNVKHRVWAAVVGGMLVLPLLAQLAG